MTTYQSKQQYVAISAIWYERFLECSRTYGTSEFKDSVLRFYHSLLDLDKEELAIKTKVTEYKETIWDPHINELVKQATQYTNDRDTIDVDTRGIIKDNIHELFNFIIQTIQDTGIGWHTSTSDGDAWDYDDAIKKD